MRSILTHSHVETFTWLFLGLHSAVLMDWRQIQTGRASPFICTKKLAKAVSPQFTRNSGNLFEVFLNDNSKATLKRANSIMTRPHLNSYRVTKTVMNII